MAEGGFENPSFHPEEIPWDDDNDDDTGGDETTPFLPTSASTPGPGEEIGMQKMQHEKTGLREKSYIETPFGASTLSERAWLTAKDLFPDMSSSELEVLYISKGRLHVKLFGAGYTDDHRKGDGSRADR